MDQIEAMRAFRGIVEAQGFTAAADRLNSTPSKLSRLLQQLEQALGVALVNRTTRRLALTEAGARYYRASQEILDRLDAAALDLAQSHEQPSGLLRVSIPTAIGVLELPDWLPAFQDAYPDIQLDVSCEDRFVDLIAGRFDLALRVTAALADSTLAARVLAESDLVMVASPGYVSRHGLPRDVEELARHRLLSFAGSGSASSWSISQANGEAVAVAVDTALQFDAITAVYAATLAGCGIAAFTQHTVARDLERGALIRILPAHTLGKRHYYALYPSARHIAPKVRAFVDFMVTHYTQAAARPTLRE